MGLGVGVDGHETISHTGIRSLDRPGRSGSLYRLRYSGSLLVLYIPTVLKIHKNILATKMFNEYEYYYTNIWINKITAFIAEY